MNKKDSLDTHQANSDKYTFKRLVGQGSYGQVFRAKERATKKAVAIKFIDFTHESPELIRAICREVKTLMFLSKLQSNIYTVKLLDIFMEASFDPADPQSMHGIYLVTNYCSIDLVKAIVDTQEKFTRSQALSLAFNLLTAVKYLHLANIIHRDLKPENILVTESLEVQIIDFGLARTID